MIIATTIAEVHAAVRHARAGVTADGSAPAVGFVPTMGALHEGHASLIRASREHDDFTVVSIFVNPIQFGPHEDLASYPRTFERDREMCGELGVDLVFAPGQEELDPGSAVVTLAVRELDEHLCGPFRPGHFAGVVTIVAKLFNIVAPDRAYFGQKDAQQAIIIRRMVRDLNWPIEIVTCPTVREPDGLALSSRNAYLSPAERQQAPCLYRALRHAESMIRGGGEHPPGRTELIAAMRRSIESVGPCRIDYVDIVDAESVQPMERLSGRILIALAVHIGGARLIDNILVDVPVMKP
jgi:pantoate--beta-alanine ligase